MTFLLDLSLSGEDFPPALKQLFNEIGLIRSEYLFREAGLYPTPANAAQVVTPYLQQLREEFSGRIWYRTLEVDSAEANTLADCDSIIIEPDRLRGLRGIRRSINYPLSYDAELEAVHNSGVEDIGIIVPFVSTIEEAEWAYAEIKKYIPHAEVACMVEVPSLIWHISELSNIGYSRIVVGFNDLGSLCFGTVRKVQNPHGISPEFTTILSDIVSRAHSENLTCIAAGYMNKNMITQCKALGFDGVSIHYSDLPQALDISPETLSQLSKLPTIKQRTRIAIEQFNNENGVHQVIY